MPNTNRNGLFRVWMELGPRGRRQFLGMAPAVPGTPPALWKLSLQDTGPLRFTDAQTPGFRVLTWQVWATNQASGCTALCVLAPFTPSQGGEGWGEATAKLWGGSCTVSSSLSSKEPPAGAEWGGGKGTGTQITFFQGKRGAVEGVAQRRQVMI